MRSSKWLKILILWSVLLCVFTAQGVQGSTIASLLPMPKLQFFGNTGKPLAGGKLYTCEPGTTCGPTTTTNLKDTYTDSTGAVANANPVVLDSAGRADIWILGYYKIALYTSAGVLVYTQDNVFAGSPNAGAAEIDILDEYGGGTNYNSTTINAAIADVGATPTTFYLKPGTWTMNANVTVPSTISIHCPIGVNIVTTGYTFNSAGPIDAGPYQIFSGSGTITLTRYPQEEAWIGSAEKLNVTNLGVSGTATIGTATVTGTTTTHDLETAHNPTVGGDQLLPIGMEMMWPTETPPARWLEEDGSAISMTTYESLYDTLGSLYGLNAGVAFTADNTTDTFTSASHGMTNGSILEVRNSGGSLPIGISAHTKYFVVGAATNTFQLSTSLGGSAINITTDGTGTHVFHNQFRIPDARGRFVRAWAHGSANDPDRASRTAPTATGATISAGDHVGTEQVGQYTSHDHGSAGAHTHTTTFSSGSDGSVFATYGSVLAGNYLMVLAVYPPTSSNGAHTHSANGGNETRPINTYRMMIIKAY